MRTAERDGAPPPRVPQAQRRFLGSGAAGFVVVVLGALALAALMYAASGLMRAIDQATAAYLNSLVAPHPVVVTVLQAVSILGSDLTGWVVVGTLVIYLLVRRRRRLATFVLVSGIGGAVLGPVVKEIVDRVRPIVDSPVATAPGPSFPSGHTLTATVVVGLLLLVFLPTAPAGARRPLVALGVLLVAMVAFTRIGLGVHFLSDVIGGFVLGIGWLAVTASAFRTWRRREGRPASSMDGGLEPEAAGELVPAPDRESAQVRPWSVAAQLLVAWVLLLGVSIVAGLLVTTVLPGSAIERADIGIDVWLADHRTAAFDALSGPAAQLGSTSVVIVVGLVAVVLVLALWRQWRPALALTVSLVGGFAIFMTAVTIVGRPRPPVTHLDGALPPTSSFPSGHTTAAICLYGAIAGLVMIATRSWWRWLVLALAVLVIVAVAVARLYRGAHFPTDVLGSALIAVPWLLLTLRLLRPDPGRGGRPDERTERHPVLDGVR